jgi:beta-N-acetylhexosaminidase
VPGRNTGTRQEIASTDLLPFKAAFDVGADLVMTTHYSYPAFTGDDDLPATVSRAITHDLLRQDLGFAGACITDLLDMQAMPQRLESKLVDFIAAVNAGADILNCWFAPDAHPRLEDGLMHATRRRLITAARVQQATARVNRLRRWLAGFAQPPLDVVAGAEHLALAREVAQRSITLVRDEAGLVPLHLDPDARIVSFQPVPRDLTPADSTAAVPPVLAPCLRKHHPRVEEVLYDDPSDDEVADLVRGCDGADMLIIGTASSVHVPRQAVLARALLATRIPAVTVALRGPWDSMTYPRTTTHICTYGILEPSLEALADALFGAIPFTGRLPVPLHDGDDHLAR